MNFTEIFTTDYVAFFMIVALGLILGSVKIKGLTLDISAIIFVAMFFGHYGVSLPPIFQQIGLILFIFSVGIQAGPGFFSAFKDAGVKLILLAVVTIGSALLATIFAINVFDIDSSFAAGLFAGAITSASGLAAASDASSSSLVTIGFALSYPFGIISIILFVRLSSKIFGIDIQKEESVYQKAIFSKHPRILFQNFIVKNTNVIGKSLSELNIRSITHTNIYKLLRNNTAMMPAPETVLEYNDILRASGRKEDLETLSYFIGPESDIEIPENQQYIIRSFLISNRKNVGKTISEIKNLHKYNSTITKIRRSGIDIVPDAGTRLRLGDMINISAPTQHMEEIGNFLGDSRDELDQIDFLPIAVGVLLGVFIGRIPLPFFNDFDFSLGLTGGVLIVAIILSKIGKTGSIVWNISGTTNQYLRKLGLIFFMAQVGSDAGKNLMAIIDEHGIQMILIGAAISIVPMVTAVAFGRKVLKINYLSLLGAITGSMTSTPALSAVQPLTKTNAPQEAYATVYPFSLVLTIMVSQIILAL